MHPRVQSRLFPYFGSTVEVDPTNDGLALSMQPGPLPFLSTFAIWLLVAKPWRSLTTRAAATEPR